MLIPFAMEKYVRFGAHAYLVFLQGLAQKAIHKGRYSRTLRIDT